MVTEIYPFDFWVLDVPSIPHKLHNITASDSTVINIFFSHLLKFID